MPRIVGALSTTQKRILLKAGFLPSEIVKFNQAKTPDGNIQDLAFSSKPFQTMIANRRRWRDRLLKKGWTQQQITDQVRKYYKMRNGRSPFDFLKIEYRPPRKLTDFQFAMKLRNKARVAKTFGKGYTSMKKELRPQNV